MYVTELNKKHPPHKVNTTMIYYEVANRRGAKIRKMHRRSYDFKGKAQEEARIHLRNSTTNTETGLNQAYILISPHIHYNFLIPYPLVGTLFPSSLRGTFQSQTSAETFLRFIQLTSIL